MHADQLAKTKHIRYIHIFRQFREKKWNSIEKNPLQSLFVKLSGGYVGKSPTISQYTDSDGRLS